MDTRTGLPVVGMVGGGQLARMTHQAAIALGQSLRVLAAAPGRRRRARRRRRADRRAHRPRRAARRSPRAATSSPSTTSTCPTAHIRALAAEGVTLYPGADALVYAQDKRRMRERLAELGAPVPRWAPVAVGTPTSPTVRLAGGAQGGPRRVRRPGRLDRRHAVGRGRADRSRTGSRADRRGARRRCGASWRCRWPARRSGRSPRTRSWRPCSATASASRCWRRRPGSATSWRWRRSSSPSTSPPSSTSSACSPSSCSRPTPGCLVNELAMRPHNSGHWTIEGARTSQFEQHLRAVLDYPMGETGLTAPAVVMANVLGGPPGGMSIDERLHHLFAEDPGAQGAPVRQAGPPGPQDRPRDRARRRPGGAARAGRAGGLVAAGGSTSDRRRRDHGQRLGLADDAGGGRGAGRVRRRRTRSGSSRRTARRTRCSTTRARPRTAA